MIKLLIIEWDDVVNLRRADNIVKTCTNLSWQKNDWCKVLSHEIICDFSPSNMVLIFLILGSPSNAKFLENSFTV